MKSLPTSVSFSCRSLLKNGLNIWSHEKEENVEDVQNLFSCLEEREDDVMDTYFSEETEEVFEEMSAYIMRHFP